MGKKKRPFVLLHSVFSDYLRDCDKALAKREIFDTKHQKLFGDRTFTVWPPCLMMFDRV